MKHRISAWVLLLAAFGANPSSILAQYVGSVSVVSQNSAIQSAGLEVLGSGGGTGVFQYKGGGNAVDAAVAASLAACVVTPGACSLGGYGGHMMIWKSGLDGERQLVTCIDFNTAAGSLASSNMFLGSVNLTNGHWTGPQPAANLYGWKAVGVPGTFAGLFMAQTNYGKKLDGTNFFSFAEILKPPLARVANGQVSGNAYYTLTSVSNLLMALYTNSPGYTDAGGNPNPYSSNDPYGTFYAGDIAQDIVAAMEAHGGLVTYADMTNYRPREVMPYMRHFNPPNGTPGWVCVAPLGSAAISVLQQLTLIEALGWTNGPDSTWDSLRYWHGRAEALRLMWKDHYQWLGDPWGGVVPPDFLGNGSTSFSDQMLAHVTNNYAVGCPWDPNEVRLTNSLARSVISAVNAQTNNTISVDWDDIRYGTCNISTSDRWGNCVAVTLSMGGGYGAQVALTNHGLVFGQGMALFDARPGWPDSIGPGKRPVDNMSPAIVIPDFPGPVTNGLIGGRPPLAIGGAGGSAIENNMVMHLVNYLTGGPSSGVAAPATSLYNFEGNKTIYMRPAYPTGVQSYLTSVGYSAPGGPPSSGVISFVQAWIPPVILTNPAGMDVVEGNPATLEVAASGLPLFYQWFKNGVALTNSALISGAQGPRLTVSSITSSATYSVAVTNGAGSVTSTPAVVTVNGSPALALLWSVGPLDGRPWMTTNTSLTQSVPNQRTIAYNSLSNHLYVVSRSSSTTSNYVIYVLNGTNGTLLYTLKTNGTQCNVGKGGIGLVGIGVADDGAIYACNESNDAAGSNGADPTSYFRVYRWANAHSNTTPSLIFSRDPSGSSSALRWGDTLSVRGAGTNTQLLVDMTYFNGTDGTNGFAAILSPTDQFMTNFSARWFTTSNYAQTAGRSLEFDPARNAIWQKAPAAALFRTTFDPSANLGGTRIASATVLGAPNFPPNLMGIGLDPGRSLAAGVCFNGSTSADSLDLYDITDLNAPVLLEKYEFPTSPRINNANRISQTFFKDDLIFSIDANNGLLVIRMIGMRPSPGTARLTNLALANGSFRFAYSNTDARTYIVQSSTNLVNWNAAGMATQTAPGWFQFTDQSSTNLFQRYYRLRYP